MKGKIITTVTALLLAMAMLAGCKGDTPPNNSDSGSAEEVVLPPIENARSLGAVICGDNFTLGLHGSGEIITTGNVPELMRELAKKRDVVFADANGGTVVLLYRNGDVSVHGENAELLSEANSWKRITSVSIGYDHLLGINADGKVMSCGNNGNGQCDIDVNNAKQIKAGKGISLVIDSANNIKVYGQNADRINQKLSQITDEPVQIEVGDSFVAILTADGRIKTTSGAIAEKWENVSKFSVYGSDIVAITTSGELLSYDDYDAEELLNPDSSVEQISLGKQHVAVMMKDGTVTSVGANSDKQCDTQLWDLRLSVSYDGYLTGFAPDMSIADAYTLAKAEFGENVQITDADGKEITDNIKTGAVLKTPDREDTEVVIYGDANGDGAINAADVSVIKTGELEGAYLAASDTLHAVSGLDYDKDVLSERIARHISGEISIHQYYHDPYYEKVHEYHNQNEDVIGYIDIDGTNIQYPILYGDDFYYHYHNIRHGRSELGTIYAVHKGLNRNNPVAGHNGRVKGIMFNQLHKVQNDKEKLRVFKNRVIGITLFGAYSEWEIFALYETGRNEPVQTQSYALNDMAAATDAQFENWINRQILRSEINLGVRPTAEDICMTLYTCGDNHYSDQNNQARLYIFLRKLGD